MKPLLLVLMMCLVAVSGCLNAGPSMDSEGHAHGEGHDHSDASHGGDEHHAHGVQGATPDEPGIGMQRSDFGPATGTTPDAAAANQLPQLNRIRIIGDSGFAPSNGVRSGNGTLDDPFVISGWYVTGDFTVQDTDACFVVRENYIGGQLSLNWNGQCVHVHHNYVNDLRVNENIRRTGYVTGGWLEHNDIGFVGQLRHYDGVFRHNMVGPRPDTAPFDAVRETTPLLAPDLLVANIDGFNQGIIAFNTFVGSVDLDFHGHHHGSGFYAPHSHYHGDNETKGMMHDHTQRWTSVAFTDNKIIDDVGYGLRFEDRNHAGDDRTAASEQEETLEEPHRHFTDVIIRSNTLEGAGIWIDVFNADDKLHQWVNPGWLTIEANRIDLVERDGGLLGLGATRFPATSAIQVALAKEVDLQIVGNQLSWKATESDGVIPRASPEPIGVDMRQFGNSTINVEGNIGRGFVYGVHALQFASDVHWVVDDNQFPGATWDVYYDESVHNRPDGA